MSFLKLSSYFFRKPSFNTYNRFFVRYCKVAQYGKNDKKEMESNRGSAIIIEEMMPVLRADKEGIK